MAANLHDPILEVRRITRYQPLVKVLRGQRRDISRQIEGAKRRRILKIR